MLITQQSQAEVLASLPEKQRLEVLGGLSDPELSALEHDWRFWARPSQIEPDGDWRIWLLLAGRGFGKSRTGAQWVHDRVKTGGARRIALVAETAADGRDVIVEGESGLLAIAPPDFRPIYESSKRRLTWPNGAMATIYNGTEPDQLRGPQHDLAWCDELAKYKRAQETWDQLQFGMRLGDHPQIMVTTTPRPIPLIRKLVKSPGVHVTRGRTMDNKANLAESFIEAIHDRYAGTRLGRQELEAELLEDTPGALWSLQAIDSLRADHPPDMQRIVVAVDPSGASGADDEQADSIGIVVAGLGVDGHGYILADRTCSLGPSGWGSRAVAAYHEFKADRLVAEKNFGGDMVRHVIHTADPNVSFRPVTATRGKVVRAEPIAALYEQGKVHHVGTFAELEDQMTSFTTTGYMGDGSPDRVDSAVWGLTELMLAGNNVAGMLIRKKHL